MPAERPWFQSADHNNLKIDASRVSHGLFGPMLERFLYPPV
jgi:hypothetical protein